MSVRTVSVKLMADVQNYVQGMRRSATTTRDLAQELNKAAAEGKVDAIADRAAAMGVALGGAAAYAVKQFADFDKQMSSVQAATHATGAEMDQLRAAALRAGAETKYSATEAAKGIEELAKAGVSTSDILNGGLNGALSLAAAGELDVGEAAEIAASAMTQFKLNGGQVPHVADLLSAAAGKAQGSVQDMGMALNQAGLVASQTGLSIEDTTGSLAAFASAGLTGSDAGTSFKQMLLMLQAPSGKTAELMQDLGISAYDANGQFIGITNLAGQLQQKLGKLTPELRASAMAQIFGADAIRGANILYEQGAAGIQAWIDKTNDAGYAAETARIKTDNLSGDLERLKGAFDTMMIEAGSGSSGGLRTLVQFLNELLDSFGRLPTDISQTMTVLAGVGGVALLAAAGWLKMRRSTTEVLEELRSTGPAGDKAAKGLERAGKSAGRAAGAFIALQAASALIASFQDDLNPNVEALASGLDKWANGGQMAGEASRLLGKDMDDLKDKFKFLADGDNNRRMAVKNIQSAFEAIVPGLAGTNESLAKTKDRVDAIDQAFAQQVGSGKVDDARKQFEALTQALAVEGVSVDEVKTMFPQYAAALEAAAKQTGATSTVTNELTGSLQQSAEAAEKANEAFNELFKQYMSSDEAALKYEESLVSTTKALKEGKRTLDLNTEAGRGNTSAILDRIKSINDARDATVEEGGSVDEANGTYAKRLETLRKDLLQMGYNGSKVDELVGKYMQIPDKVATNVQQPGMAAARVELNRYDVQIDTLTRLVATSFSQPGMPGSRANAKSYDSLLDQIARQIKTEIKVNGDGPASAKLQHLLDQQRALQSGVSVAAGAALNRKDADRNRQRAYATGGWTGPGSTHDEAGIVHADEFVVRKESRSSLEGQNPGALDYMNRTGQWPGYAAGGRVVSAPFSVDARKTKIMSLEEALSKVIPAVPSGGRTSDFIVRAARALDPDARVISKDRPGARTLSGNRSYHSMGRAVDFEPSEKLARLWNARYMGSTKELISPYQRYNIHNGKRHQYSGAVWMQHNFGGGNAHDHIAMAGGGVIREPIYGVGASGKTYSFGEGYRPETVTPGVWQRDPGSGAAGGGGNTYNLNVSVPATAHPAEVGRVVVSSIQAYERGSGKGWRTP